MKIEILIAICIRYAWMCWISGLSVLTDCTLNGDICNGRYVRNIIFKWIFAKLSCGFVVDVWKYTILKSTLAYIMACCIMAPSCNLYQCLIMLPYCIIPGQEIKLYAADTTKEQHSYSIPHKICTLLCFTMLCCGYLDPGLGIETISDQILCGCLIDYGATFRFLGWILSPSLSLLIYLSLSIYVKHLYQPQKHFFEENGRIRARYLQTQTMC